MLPTAEERDALLEALGELIEEHGARDFLAAPVLDASREYFPDEWRPDRDGTGAMLRRLLSWARMADAPFELHEFDAEEEIEIASAEQTRFVRPLHGVAAWFSGDDRKTLRFGVDVAMLNTPETLAGVLAHEVSHAWRYRRNEHVQDTGHEEQLTDVTTVFLGFGVLVCNNAERRRSSGAWDARRYVQQYSHESYGYLSPGALVWLLAAQLAARRDAALVARVEDRLERNQRADLREALELLNRNLPALDARLRLPSPDARVSALPFTHPPVQRLPERETTPPPAPAATSTLAHAFRIKESRSERLGSAFFYFLGGLMVAMFASSYGTMTMLWLIIALPTLRMFYAPLRCSSCERTVRATDERCANCALRLVGTLERRRDVHAASADWLRRHGSPEAQRALQADLLLEQQALAPEDD